ncbi:MAG TPA: RecX family transcriptional regulator [Candidatus Saccharimonadales bacterium]|jgi:regulatory protein|nr:RecX family transcriptional regulator [Candidatus Saccharimonadales bacterium]
MKISAIKQQVKRKDRYSVYIDGTYSFSLSESGLIENRLASGQELTDSDLQNLKKTAGLDKAYGNALRYVAMRPRSEWELRDYFRRKGVDEEYGSHIADRLRGVGLLDDLAFARAWASNRRLLKSISKRRLRLELQQKHVPSDVINQVLAEDETDERTALAELIEKKQARYPDRQKFMQYLARQGFSFDDIKSALDGNTYD